MDSPSRPGGATVIYPASEGELRRLIAAKDWSQTSLGPRALWSQSLKTALSIALSSRFPMLIWWGKDLSVLYNDAYIPIFAKKHPEVLGKRGVEAWGEVWDVIGPMLEAVMQRGDTTWSRDELLELHRKGFVEESYFTWSYSPIADETGGVGGVLTSVIETTDRILSERRLKVLRDFGESSRSASAGDAWRAAAQITAQDRADLPFVLLYAASEGRADLAAWSGIDEDHPAAVARLALDADLVWPAAQVLKSAEPVVVSDLRDRFGEIRSSWPEPVERAATIAIPSADPARPLGFAVVGLSPRLAFDDSYRSFVNLLANQIGNSVGNAIAYEQERSRAESLAEIDRAKTTFFSNVSHEFRTPLTLILGPLEDALTSHGRALAGETVQSVHRNALRLLKLVNSLLDFARIEAGRAQATYEATDLAALTADLASAFRSTVERAGLRFEVECPPLAEPIWVDHDMWEKIVLNLLSNALKFTFEGSIAVRLGLEGGQAELTVRDTGTGIPGHELPRLFERFHRVEGARSRTHEGSGIGLALVHELVRLHGGSIQVDSAPGKGSTFRVRVPRGSAHLAREKLGDRRALASTATGAAPYVQEALRWLPGTDDALQPMLPSDGFDSRLREAQAHAGARILLADDNADMRDYVRRLLGERWKVEVARDGAEALAAARRERPDLVLTDVMMPNLDGFGLLRALRADEATRTVPVVMLSARAGEESRVEGLEAGADDYLPKPFSARELVARVATHLQIAALRSAAEKEREKLRELFMQAPVPVAVFVGPEHRYEVANAAYCEMVDRPQLVGKTVREAFPEIGEHQVIASLDHVLRTGETVRVAELTVAIRRRGSPHPGEAFFDYVAHPLREISGEVTGVMVVATEVTEQVLARRHVDSLRAAAETANRAKDEFLAMLGHELRNPLAPIVTALHLMKLRGGGAMEKERSVVERQVSHLIRLVDDLLDVSRITRGKIELAKEPVELAEVVARAIEMSSPLLEQRQHHLVVSVPPVGLAVEGDATRLAQVVSNLLTNAAKYTPASGHVEVSARREGHRVLLSVKDDGTGIAPEVLPRVFDLFVQERQPLDRSEGGLGLGLAIVRSLVAMHGGTVEARSEGRNRGSEFIISLPVAQRQFEPQAADLQLAPGSAATSSGRRILVVDDNADAADMLSESLRAAGHVTRVAADGLEALRIVSEFRPDTALLDIGLPAMDGYELARRLRDQLGEMKLVAITGYGQAADKARASAAGFDDHLVKPVQIDQLHALLGDRADAGANRSSPDQSRSPKAS